MTQFRVLFRALEIVRTEGVFALLSRVENRYAPRLLDLVMNEALFHLVTNVRYWMHVRRFDAPANPYKTIGIDPNDVDRFVTDVASKLGLGQVRGGRWDAVPVDEVATYRSVIQRYEEGRDWAETRIYRTAQRKIDEEGSFEGYDTTEQFETVRCEFVDSLFEEIRDGSYRPNYEDAHVVPDRDTRSGERSYKHSLEPLVAIGPTGEIFLVDGAHRIAIAAVLNVDSVPVNVVARHERWQRIRDELSDPSADGPSRKLQKYVHHPDAGDLAIRSVRSPRLPPE